MTKISISFDWSNLNEDTKEEMIERVKQELMTQYEADGKMYLAREWNDPKPQSWQEAYVRLSAIHFIMWKDYEAGSTNPDDKPTQGDWEYWIEEQIKQQAEDRLWQAFKYSQVEVEL